MNTNRWLTAGRTRCFLKFQTLTIMLILALVFCCCMEGYAASSKTPFITQSVSYPTGTQIGNGTSYTQAYTNHISVSGAHWMLLHFTDVSLGASSYIEMSNTATGTQIFDATTIAQWENYSAFFNGSYVDIKLWVAPTDANIHFTVDQLLIGQGSPTAQESNCYNDDRVPSSDQRIGRFDMLNTTGGYVNSGTAFITDYGYLITAGHTIADAAGLIKRVDFNVSNANGDGDAGFGNTDDQYAFGSLVNSENGGRGNDWAVFTIIDNSKSYLLKGAFSIDRYYPGTITARVTGYGADLNRGDYTRNLTQQTTTGALVYNNNPEIKYNIFTESGESGGPVINTQDGHVLGVHTQLDCGGTPPIGNLGTSFLATDLWDNVATVNVTVDQTALDLVNQKGIHRTTQGTIHIGYVTRWYGSSWDGAVLAPHTWTYTPSGAPPNLTFAADPLVYQSRKFHHWTGDQHTIIGEFPSAPNLVSYFEPIATGVVLESELQGATTIDGGIILFKDPWLNDTPDIHNGAKKNNRVMAADFKQCSSPTTLNLTVMDDQGNKYNGVFFDQRTDVPNPVYYSVRAPLTQPIGGSTVQFDRWEATGATIVDIGDNTAGYDTKAVIFTSEGAIVKAIYKPITTVSTTVLNAWNMLGVPVKEVDFSRTAVYPNAVTGAEYVTTWTGTTYTNVSTLDNRIGYWVKYPSSQGVTYSGIAKDSFHIGVKTGWNMVGSLYSDIDRSKVSGFNTSLASNFFGFNAGYFVATTLQAGKGYWVKVTQDGQLYMDKNSTGGGGILPCEPQPPNPAAAPSVPNLDEPENGTYGVSTTPTLTWYASSGATSYQVQVATDICCTSIVYDYSGVTTTSKQTGSLSYSTRYYWRVRATNGTLSNWSNTYTFVVQSNGGGGGGGCYAASLAVLDQFTVTDASGNSQSLYSVNGGRSKNLGFTDFDMPPTTPKGIFHGRFKSGKFVETTSPSNGKSKIPIIVKDAKYPITLKWRLVSENATKYWLDKPGNGHKQIELTNSGSIAINNGNGNDLVIIAESSTPCIPLEEKTSSRTIDLGGNASGPTSYVLQQNMPNPFNPVTMINYELPEAGRVTLKVYNTLGQEVATLVDGMEDAGYKTARFDGSNLSSGVYFYRLTAGGFSDMKKMILVK
jgi:hypothetical protein